MQPLDQGSVVLDASGAGRVAVSPPPGRRWRVERVTIAVAGTTTLQPRAYLYRGAEIPANQLDATYQGRRNTTEASIVLDAGEPLVLVWTGGTPGEQASMMVDGTEAPSSMSLTAGASLRRFELPLTSLDPNIPAVSTRQQVSMGSADLFSVAGTLATGAPSLTSNVLDVRDWQTITHHLSHACVLPCVVRLTFTYFADPQGLVQLNVVRYYTSEQKLCIDQHVTEGSYLRVSVEFLFVGAAPQTVALYVRARNGPLLLGQGVENPISNLPQTMLSWNTATLAAGGFQNQYCQYVQRGNATLTIDTDGASSLAIVRPMSPAGTFPGTHVAIAGSLGGGTFRQTVQFYSPGTLLRHDIVNAGGAVFTINSSINLGPTT